jgi:hypothetical protein
MAGALGGGDPVRLATGDESGDGGAGGGNWFGAVETGVRTGRSGAAEGGGEKKPVAGVFTPGERNRVVRGPVPRGERRRPWGSADEFGGGERMEERDVEDCRGRPFEAGGFGGGERTVENAADDGGGGLIGSGLCICGRKLNLASGFDNFLGFSERRSSKRKRKSRPYSCNS